MDVTWQAMVIMGMLLIGILLSIVLYTWKSEFYNKHQTAIRKIYYGVILAIGYLLWATKAFPVSNVAGLTILVVSIVVIDLFVFQTPVITKFLSQEFKPVEAVKTIENTDEVLIGIHKRILMVNKVTPKVGIDDTTVETLAQRIKIEEDFNFSYSQYEAFLMKNLEGITSELNLLIYPYAVASSDKPNVFFENVKTSYGQIREEYKFSSLHEGMRIQLAVQKLCDGENIVVNQNNKLFIILPFWGFYGNTLFVITDSGDKSEKTLYLADVPLLLNLLYSLEEWLRYYECKKELWTYQLALLKNWRKAVQKMEEEKQ